jgi:putative ABC transport system substrate-binding protein
MKRRDFIALVAGAIVERPIASMAQETGRTYRFGILEPFSDTPVSVRRIDELRRRGFIEGQNLVIHRRGFGLHGDLISQFAAELAKAHVDVIEAAGSVATRAAQQATKTIPIIASQTIWSGKDWSTRCRGPMATQRALVSSRPSLTENGRNS